MPASIERGMTHFERDAWNALVPADGSPCVEWDWLDALESSACATPERGWIASHLALREGGRLVGAAPAYVECETTQGDYLDDVVWVAASRALGVPYHPKLVVGVPYTPVPGARLLTAGGDAPRRTIAAALTDMVRESAVASAHVVYARAIDVKALAEHGWLPRLGWQYHWHDDGYADFDGFLRGFRSHRRHTIRRELAALHDDGVRVSTTRGPIAAAEMREAHGLYRETARRWEGTEPYLTEGFFVVLAERFPGRLELVRATHCSSPDRPIGVAVNVRHESRLYGRYWGCARRQRFLHYLACYYHPVRECIERGIRVFEPGAGGEHKAARGFDPTPTWSAHWFADRRLGLAVARWIEAERLLVADLLHMPELGAGEPRDDLCARRGPLGRVPF